MLATEYAREYGIEGQRDGERDVEFRSRVSGALRDMGRVIEAHEAYQDARHDQSSEVITGLMGAVAQAMQEVNYGSRGERQIGDDIAAGVVVQAPKEDPLTLMMAMMMMSK